MDMSQRPTREERLKNNNARIPTSFKGVNRGGRRFEWYEDGLIETGSQRGLTYQEMLDERGNVKFLDRRTARQLRKRHNELKGWRE